MPLNTLGWHRRGSSHWISSLLVGTLFWDEVGKESSDRKTRIRKRRSSGMHLKKGGGESLYCRHSCYDYFRDVVYANITSNPEMLLYISTSSSLHNHSPTHCHCPSFSRRAPASLSALKSKEKRGHISASPRVDLSTNAHPQNRRRP